MVTRKIITINEELCNGCGQCIPNCPEGALQIIDNKVRLISDRFCDGLGACLGHCPVGAISVEEREAQPYDERIVMENIIKQGPNVIKAHLDHLREHGETDLLAQATAVLREKNISVPAGAQQAVPLQADHHHGGGCPGSRMLDRRNAPASSSPAATATGPVQSELRQWPIQLTLLSPNAPYFTNADLVIAADCVPFAYPNFHQKFLKDKILAIFCPKLDENLDDYIDKLTMIFKNQSIKSVSVVHMEVPCCYGAVEIVQQALEKSGKNIIFKEYTVSLQGEII